MKRVVPRLAKATLLAMVIMLVLVARLAPPVQATPLEGENVPNSGVGPFVTDQVPDWSKLPPISGVVKLNAILQEAESMTMILLKRESEELGWLGMVRLCQVDDSLFVQKTGQGKVLCLRRDGNPFVYIPVEADLEIDGTVVHAKITKLVMLDNEDRVICGFTVPHK